MGSVHTMEVEEERLPAATPRRSYPISEAEEADGWDTLINQCWLQCSDCNRWRNVPKEVRDEVSCRTAGFTSVSHIPAASLTWVS